MLSCDYFLDFFSFFLLVAQPFLEAADLDAAVVFFEVVFFAVVFFLDTILVVGYHVLFDHGMTKNIVNEDKRKDNTRQCFSLIFQVL